MRILQNRAAAIVAMMIGAAFNMAGQSQAQSPTLCDCPLHSPSQKVDSFIVTKTTLTLPEGLPQKFSVKLPFSEQHLTLQLEKNQVFGENTRFLVSDETGSLTEVNLGLDRSYLGKVLEQPGFSVSAVLAEEGLIATIIRPGQKSITVTPLFGSEKSPIHEVSISDTSSHQACQNEVTTNVITSPPVIKSESTAEMAASTAPIATSFSLFGAIGASGISSTATLPPTRVMDVLEYEIGVEIGSAAFLGGNYTNLAQAQSVAQGIPSNLDARYLRAAGIKHRLGTVIIRTSAATDPLAGQVTNGNDSSGLSDFRNYWNNNPGEVGNTHDLAVYHVRGAPSGLAYVNSVGTSNRYALSASNGPTSWADGTLVHEFGHSWNLRHTGDAPITEYDEDNYNNGETPPNSFYETKPRSNSGSNSAGGNHLFVSIMHGSGTHNIGRLSTDEANTVYGIRQNKRNFGDLVANPGEIPPFGRRDSAIASGEPITIDVIENDYDSNNNVLDAQLLDTVSQKGGTISLSVGTGPGGRNQITYTPPNGVNGPDFFHYTVCDTTGRTDWGAVYIDNQGPTSIDLTVTKYLYDVGTPSSPIFTGSSDTYLRLSDFTFGDLGFTSNGPNPVESRDRAENGPISGVNDINRDHIRMRSTSTFHHKLAPGIYDVLFTVGDAVEPTASIRMTAEGSDVITTASHDPGAFTNYTFQDISVTDGELNIAIENLGFSSNISRIIITRVGILVDTSLISYNYDPGTTSSPVQSGWTQLTPNSTGDVYWTGAAVGSQDRNPGGGVNNINRDFIEGSGTSTLNHKIANGTWGIVFNMGDSDSIHDLMGIRVEGQLISNNITAQAGQYVYADENGASPTPTGFQVVVSDGELNIEFSDNGGSDPNWVVNRISFTRVNGDLDNDSYSDYLEIAAGTNPEDPLSKPVLSSGALAGHWPMDETSGGTAADASGLGHNAVWAGNNGENTWVTGLIGGAAQINDENGGSGEEHFRIANLSSLNTATSLSVSLWFNQNVDTNNNSNYNGLFMTRDLRSTLGTGNGENWGVALENNNSPRHIDWRVGGGSFPETDNILGNTVDTWQHVLYVWDGTSGTAQLYQDGVLVNSSSSSAGSILTGNEWRIGDDACCNNREFTGSLDDIAVFRAPLNADDAAMVYQAGLSGYSIDNLIGPDVSAPAITTGSSSAITQTSANIAYSVSDDGGEAPTLTLYYGTSNGGTTPGNWTSYQALGTQSSSNYNTSLSNLSPNTTYYYSIYGSNSGGQNWGSTSNFTTLANNYSTWATANSVTGGSNGDDDGDGISNLEEYALGLDPKVPNSSPGNLNGKFLSYTKGSEAVNNGDLTYTIETSPNLQNPWTPVTPDTNNATTISFTLPTGQGTIFARLRVTQN